MLSQVPQHVLWDGAFARMLEEWQNLATEQPGVADWDQAFARMCAENEDLRDRGLWRTGGRTLMRELWVHHSEIHLCRGLAWLLTPDGWHGLGGKVLSGILSALGLSVEGAGRAIVALEEVRHTTRADVIVRLPTTTLLIEAKVFALEQPAQADRLASEWADESPALLFLTRRGAEPLTALDSRGEWHTMTWRQVASIARGAARESDAPSPGALEFIGTLEEYGGR